MENKYCKLKTKLQKGRKNATVEYVTLIHITVLVILLYNIVKFQCDFLLKSARVLPWFLPWFIHYIYIYYFSINYILVLLFIMCFLCCWGKVVRFSRII